MPLAILWLGIQAVASADWGFAPVRALVLLCFLCAAVWMIANRGRSRFEPPWPGRAPKPLWILLGLAHLTALSMRCFATHTAVADIATTTLQAGQAMAEGLNPYTLPIDPSSQGGHTRFDGFKYMPVMALSYLPLGVPMGARGLLVTNAAVNAGVGAMIWRVAARDGGAAAGDLAALFYLSLPLVLVQTYVVGATDSIPVLLLLISIWLGDRSPFLAGLCVGLSIAAKPAPGFLFTAYSLPRGGRALFGLGCIAGLAPLAPFLIGSTRPFIDNTILFMIARPIDSTALLGALAPVPALAAQVLAACAVLATALCVWRLSLNLFARCCLAVIGTIALILVGHAAHTNYQLWWLPMFCVALANTFRGRETDPATSRQPARQ